jgi:hypothetical protein
MKESLNFQLSPTRKQAFYQFNIGFQKFCIFFINNNYFATLK